MADLYETKIQKLPAKLPSTHSYVIFVLEQGECLPPFDMAINSIGTQPGSNQGLTFRIGRKEFSASQINDENPVILVHHSDAFEIVSAESWPIFVTAVVALDTFLPGGRG